MTKIYPTVRLYSVISGIVTLWFIVGCFVILFAPEIQNRSSAIFLILISILSILVFIRTLRLSVSSDEKAIYFRTLLKNFRLPWSNITEIQVKQGKTGLYYVLIGKLNTGKTHKINLGILKNKEELLRDIVANNPSIVIDERIRKRVLRNEDTDS